MHFLTDFDDAWSHTGVNAESLGFPDVAFAAFIGAEAPVSGRLARLSATNAARFRAADEAAFRLDTFHAVVALEELCRRN